MSCRVFISVPVRFHLEESAQTQTLFVIAFIGSLDDLTLFVPMLVGKGHLDSTSCEWLQFLAMAVLLFAYVWQPVPACVSGSTSCSYRSEL